jgi:hypothetical protein
MRELKIGRLPLNDIIIDDVSVSREHATLIISGDEFSIRDLGSSNGTFVNGMRINGVTRLKRNDILKVGSALVPWMNYLSMNDAGMRTQFNPQPQPQSIHQQDAQNYGTKLKLPNSSGALTLGIIGLVFSLALVGIILNILAISLGSGAISRYNAEPGKYTESSLSQAKSGKVLGIVGLGIFGLVLLYIIIQNS